MKKTILCVVLGLLLIFPCQGQQEEKTNWWYDEITFSVSDTMVTISSQIDMGLSRWHSKHENWAEAETDSIFPTLQKMLDSIASFAKRDPNCSYVITRYGTSYWKWGNRRLSMNRAELLKDYLVWCGVDSSSIWITLDTIPNCQPLEYSKNCLHYYEIKKQFRTFVFIPYNTIVNSFPIVENNIKYTIGVENNKIIYTSTTDKNFTIGDLKINDLLPKSYFDREWGYIPGWGYYMEIESGWYASFDFQTKPDKKSRIQWFFKFDFNK